MSSPQHQSHESQEEVTQLMSEGKVDEILSMLNNQLRHFTSRMFPVADDV